MRNERAQRRIGLVGLLRHLPDEERDSCTLLTPAQAQRNDRAKVSAEDRLDAIQRFSGPLRRKLGINSPEEEPLHDPRLRGG